MPLNLRPDFLMIPSPTVLKCPDLHIFLRPRGAYRSARKYRSVCRVAIGRPMKSACNSSGFASRYYPNFRGFFLRCRRKMIPPCVERRAPGCFDFPGPAVQALAPIRLCFICGAASGRLIVFLESPRVCAKRCSRYREINDFAQPDFMQNLISLYRAFAIRYDYAAHDFCAVVPR